MGSPPGYEPRRRQPGEGRRHPAAAAVVIVVVTLAGASAGTVVALNAFTAAGANAEPLWAVMWLGLAVVVLLVGGWWAWRVGSGRSWARGRPGAASIIVLVTLLLTAILAIAAAATFSAFAGGTPDSAGGVGLTVVAVAAFLGGLWLAWRVGTGHLLPPPEPPLPFDEPPPAPPA
jgi:hypothetical protein